MKSRRKCDGFTLTEVLIVVAILGVLAAMVVPQLIGRQEDAYFKATESSISSLEQTLNMYAAENGGQFPQGNADEVYATLLSVRKSASGRVVKPYLEEIPKDAWGNPIGYEFPTSKVPHSLKPALWSYGPNGKNDSGTGDDLNNWSKLDVK